MVLAILQARVSSTRLPGKVLKPVLGKPMLLMQIERVQRSKLIDQLLIATSNHISDDQIEALCRENQVLFYRGSLNDVLDRFFQTAKLYNPSYIVRLTGDCPLADPLIIDRVIDFHLKGNLDYTSNVVDRTFPAGLDVEIFRFSCLKQAWEEAELPSEREHVTPFIYKHPERFKIGSFINKKDLSGFRWTVDEEPDFQLITKIYEALYPINSNFDTEDILAFLAQNPALININAMINRNEGMRKSLVEDELYLKKRKRAMHDDWVNED